MARTYKTYNRKPIQYEDDLVIVFDENGSQIYKGIEDYEPLNDESWRWDKTEKIYRYKGYIKVCLQA